MTARFGRKKESGTGARAVFFLVTLLLDMAVMYPVLDVVAVSLSSYAEYSYSGENRIGNSHHGVGSLCFVEGEAGWTQSSHATDCAALYVHLQPDSGEEFFENLPESLMKATESDGVPEPEILSKIVVPLSKPMLKIKQHKTDT